MTNPAISPESSASSASQLRRRMAARLPLAGTGIFSTGRPFYNTAANHGTQLYLRQANLADWHPARERDFVETAPPMTTYAGNHGHAITDATLLHCVT